MASTYLTRNTGGSGTSGTIATLSLWVKLSDTTNFMCVFSASSNSTGSPFCLISREGTGEFRFSDYTNNTTVRAEKITSALARDVNGWYHIVVAIDTNQTTASDRIKFYINGVLQTSFSSDINYSLGATTSLGQNNEMVIGRYEPYNAGYWNGLVSHFHYTDGTAYDASTFGETDATTGIWKPKTQPSVIYGSNGFFLKFENSGSMGLDSSGNANNFTVNGNLTQTVDTPTNVFATLNLLIPNVAGNCTLSAGNTKIVSLDAAHRNAPATIALKTGSGKWYWEMKAERMSTHIKTGIVYDEWNKINQSAPTQEFSGSTQGYAYRNDGQKENNTVTAYGSSYTVGDIIGIAFDAENRKLYFSKNGTWQNSADPAAGTGEAFTVQDNSFYYPIVNLYNADVSFNFGNGYFNTTPVASAGSNGNGAIFEYDVPTGYYALNTKNINTYG